MAFICYKEKGSCASCKHHRLDQDKNRHACFIEEDMRKEDHVSDDARSALSKIAEKSGMDCWFTLVHETTQLDCDLVFDFEENRMIPLEDALPEFAEGIAGDAKFYGLSAKEAVAVDELFKRYGIEKRLASDPVKERCADCAALVEGEDGKWICDENGSEIHEIAECNEWNNEEDSESDSSSHWHEIRINYINESDDDMFWRVDAWETDDDDEEGIVIALIDDLTARVYYIDPLARVDEYAQERIQAKVEEIKASNKLLVEIRSGFVSVRLRTAKGTLVAEAEPGELVGGADCADEDAIYTMFCPDGTNSIFDIAGVRSKDGDITIRTFEDPSTDDATNKKTIRYEDFKKADS